MLKQQQEEAAVKECTFHPVINHRSDRLMSERSEVLRVSHRLLRVGLGWVDLQGGNGGREVFGVQIFMVRFLELGWRWVPRPGFSRQDDSLGRIWGKNHRAGS